MIDFILRATLASDLKANEKLFFKEILPQLASLTFAGSDTTSTLLQSCLVHLGRRPDIQDRLQVELDDFFSSLPEDTDPDWDQINALPFLSSVISEVLRFSPPVPGLQRNPMNDDIIPLSRPIKCTDGKMISHIKVKKGTNILLGTGANARLKEIWGEVSHVFIWGSSSPFLTSDLEHLPFFPLFSRTLINSILIAGSTSHNHIATLKCLHHIPNSDLEPVLRSVLELDLQREF